MISMESLDKIVNKYGYFHQDKLIHGGLFAAGAKTLDWLLHKSSFKRVRKNSHKITYSIAVILSLGWATYEAIVLGRADYTPAYWIDSFGDFGSDMIGTYYGLNSKKINSNIKLFFKNFFSK